MFVVYSSACVSILRLESSISFRNFRTVGLEICFHGCYIVDRKKELLSQNIFAAVFW